MISDPRDIILSPVVSEKSYGLLESGRYTFLVHPDANKTQVKIAIEKIFDGQGGLGEHDQPPGQAQAHPGRLRSAQVHQARDRHAVRGQQADRDLHRRLSPIETLGTDQTMGIRKYKPTTPGRRGASVSDFAELTRDTPEKSLIRPLHSKGGRNVHGRVTARHQGGGHKRAYRLIDFRRADKDGVPAKVAHIEYDPNRTARIALLHYADGEKRYIIAPNRLRQGDAVETGAGADIKPGNNLPLRNIPVGTVVHAIELRPGGGAKIARSAGTKVQLVAKDGPYAQLRMPSGEIRNVDVRCRATIGEVGNAEQAQHQLGQGRPHALEGQAPAPSAVSP